MSHWWLAVRMPRGTRTQSVASLTTKTACLRLAYRYTNHAVKTVRETTEHPAFSVATLLVRFQGQFAGGEEGERPASRWV